MKKCYHVSTVVDVLVLADSEDEARELGDYAIREELCNISATDLSVKVATHLPGGWTGDALVYHDGREDVTATEALKLNPEYATAQGRVKELAERIKADK